MDSTTKRLLWCQIWWHWPLWRSTISLPSDFSSGLQSKFLFFPNLTYSGTTLFSLLLYTFSHFLNCYYESFLHDDVIKWKHFPRHWPFVRGIHRSSVNSTHKGQRRGTFVVSLSCAWTNDWVNNRDAADLRRRRAYYDVTVMYVMLFSGSSSVHIRTVAILTDCQILMCCAIQPPHQNRYLVHRFEKIACDIRTVIINHCKIL